MTKTPRKKIIAVTEPASATRADALGRARAGAAEAFGELGELLGAA